MSSISAETQKELVTAVATRHQEGTAVENVCILADFVALAGYYHKQPSGDLLHHD